MTDHDPQKQPSCTAKTYHCEYCLQEHAEDGSCSCADCKCDMHPEFIVPYRDGDTRIALCPDCYKSRRSKKSQQVDDPTCPSCGVTFRAHLGLIQTCAKLRVELENKRALEAFIAKLEAQNKVTMAPTATRLHGVVMPVPECIADAPKDVIDAAKKIARTSLNIIRNVIAEEFPKVDAETQNDFVRAICQFMNDSA